jgi:TolB-like protein
MSVTALLTDGATGRVLWGGTFPRHFAQGNIAAVCDEVAESVAQELYAFFRSTADPPPSD